MKKNCNVCGTVNRSSRHRMSCLKGTKFIRILKRSYTTKLRLPSVFGRNVAEFLEDRALLYGHGVNLVSVQVVHSNGSCTLGKGWGSFCVGHKVVKGSVLVFKYLGYSAFKVDIFNGRTGLKVDESVPSGNGAGDGDLSSEAQAEARPVGRPPVVYQESEEVGHVKLYGMKLRRLTMYNLRAELRRRKLEEDGCKGELIERLGRFIMRHGEDYHFERIRFGQEWRWM